jgi:hypothetical protein
MPDGPQMRWRAVFEAGLGCSWVSVGLARDGGRWAISGSHLGYLNITKLADA